MLKTVHSGKFIAAAAVFVIIIVILAVQASSERVAADPAVEPDAVDLVAEAENVNDVAPLTEEEDVPAPTRPAEAEVMTNSVAAPEQAAVIEPPQEPPAAAPVTAPVAARGAKPGKSFNDYVLDLIKTYGNTPYLLNKDYANYSGVTETLVYKDRVVARAHPSGNRASHCAGITFEVFFKAMQQRNKDLGLDPGCFGGMSWDELRDFMLIWYVAKGPKSNAAAAVEKYGLGRRVSDLEQARPGDFMQYSRENRTGHAVVFLNWLRDGSGRIIGFRYWSSQKSTNGIGYREEYFNVTDARGQKHGNVMLNTVYIARVEP